MKYLPVTAFILATGALWMTAMHYDSFAGGIVAMVFSWVLFTTDWKG